MIHPGPVTFGANEARPADDVPRRSRPRWRRILGFATGAAIAVVLAAGTVRVTSLWGLPDAPEPFDVAAFRAETIPDDANAVVLFLAARRHLGADIAGAFETLRKSSRDVEWSRASPELRAWATEHRAALEVWRRGAERHDAIRIGGNAGEFLNDSLISDWLHFALLEASRLEGGGDLGGAWACHRARLRASLLVGRRWGLLGRNSASTLFRQSAIRARTWADQPGISAPLLRRAIADVEAMARLHDSDSAYLKHEYIQMMADLDAILPLYGDPERIARTFEGARNLRVPAPPVPRPLRLLYGRVATYLEGEPERSRRVARMVFANWLAQADKKPSGRAKTVSTYPLVFDAGPSAGTSLPPAALARRAATAPFFAIARAGDTAPPAAWFVADRWPSFASTDRRARAELILVLAERVYEIETGETPTDVQALVGSVLSKLPDDGPPDDNPDP